MTVESQRSTQIDLFYVGLGAAIGVIAALAVYGAFQVMAGVFAAGALASAADSTGTAQSLLASEASAMGLPLVEGTKAYWFVARAGGIIAYLLLWLAAFWGISMSSKMVRGWVDASLIYGMHEFLPILAMIFASLHALVLLGDAYIGFSLTDLLLPFVGTLQTHLDRSWHVGTLSGHCPDRQLLSTQLCEPARLARISLPVLSGLYAGDGPWPDGRHGQRPTGRALDVSADGYQPALCHVLPCRGGGVASQHDQDGRGESAGSWRSCIGRTCGSSQR